MLSLVVIGIPLLRFVDWCPQRHVLQYINREIYFSPTRLSHIVAKTTSPQEQPLSPIRLFLLTALAMMAFAGNSLLCRVALKATSIDAASFTSIRLVSGALMLWVLTSSSREKRSGHGNWPSAVALFAYTAAFSFAYLSISAATGALLLFAAVQATMISYGIARGERLGGAQLVGLVLALAGVVWLLLPGLAAPPLVGSLLMIGAGVAWGVYSLRGRSGGSPIKVTAGNFLRAAPISLALCLATISHQNIDVAGSLYAIASGALTSGVGYAIWYTALPALKATHAATIQLSVPALAAVGGIVFLGEAVSLQLALASVAILGGIALVIKGNYRSH